MYSICVCVVQYSMNVYAIVVRSVVVCWWCKNDCMNDTTKYNNINLTRHNIMVCYAWLCMYACTYVRMYMCTYLLYMCTYVGMYMC